MPTLQGPPKKASAPKGHGGGGGDGPGDGDGGGEHGEGHVPEAADNPASAGLVGPDGRLLNSRVTLSKSALTWLPGVGELEDWRLDVILRVITASGIGQLLAGPWIRRVFEPDCTFEDLGADGHA